jgi:hypothetical protein
MQGDASIFFLTGQEDIAGELDALLRNEIHPNIDIRKIEIDPKYGQKSPGPMHENCGLYLQLLRASFVTSDAFEIVLNNDWQTSWCYFGHSATTRGTYCFELRHMDMTSLFPAVSMMRRIVMLPASFHDAVSVHPREFLSLARPLDLGGVELVDFRRSETIRHAIGRVAAQIRREWKNLCHRHIGIRGLLKPDFAELAKLLKVSERILASNVSFSSDVRLVPSFSGEALENAPSNIVLELRNHGSRVLRSIRVRVRAPRTVMKPFISDITDLIPPTPLYFPLQLTPKTAPFCPLEVFVDHGDDPLDVPPQPMPLLVPVQRYGG